MLRAGKKDRLMPVRFLLEKVPAQCLGVIAADPFLLPTKKFPDGISPEDRRRLTRQITETVVKEVLPAYLAFGKFIAEEYAPYGRTTLSVTSLPGGEKRYLNDIRSRTTLTKLTPDQIHQIGLHEIERIEAEMLAIAQSRGFRGSCRVPRFHPGQSQVSADLRRTDRRGLPQVHRADATEAAGAVRLHSRVAGDRRADA